MLTIQHPDYDHEMEYLAKTQARITELRSNESEYDPAESLVYPNPVAAAWLRRNIPSKPSLYDAVAREPYFARVDFQKDGESSSRGFYLGNFAVGSSDYRTHLVYDWRAPIGQLYYQRASRYTQYEAPAGLIRGVVSLRRRFKIRWRDIEEISDEVPGQLMDIERVEHSELRNFGTEAPLIVDDYLRELLEERKEGRLRDIVSTIQSEQDEIIRKPLEEVLIVRGVAGSGKTSVALHRLAYLLYTHYDILALDRIVVFGPNKLFLDSIANILPNLGIDDIKQTTFEEWAVEWLNRNTKENRRRFPVEYDRTHEPLERFLDSSADRRASIAAYRISRFKGSLRMMQLLQAYRDLLVDRFCSAARAITVNYILSEGASNLGYSHDHVDFEVSLSADRVQDAIAEVDPMDFYKERPLNLFRTRLKSRIVAILSQQLLHSRGYQAQLYDRSGRMDDRRRDAFLKDKGIEHAVADQLDQWWPQHDPVRSYQQLFCDIGELKAVAAFCQSKYGTQFTAEELALLLRSPFVARKHLWAVEDLPILLYLDLLLNGRTMPTYDYFVVDEVQDMSPLQIAILRQTMKENSIILLGDVAQGVYSYRGITTWSEVEEVFAGESITTATLANSYRSTFEISALANQVLRHKRMQAVGVTLAKPVGRHGTTPAFQQFATWQALASASIQAVSHALQKGAKSAAIICKTAVQCEHLADLLPPLSDDILQPTLSADDAQMRQIVLIPAYLAKGLEFDCVVIAGADADTYTDREYDIKLLYLALTRALHELHVFWVGTMTSLLPSSLAVVGEPRL